MLSPVLLAIVLKKTDVKKGVHSHELIRMVEAFDDLFEGSFPHLAALTLQLGMSPFLCVLISKAFDSSSYICKRFLAFSKFLVVFSNILLMILGCVVLYFITRNAWFSWLIVSACIIVAAVAICSSCWCWWYNQAGNNEPEDDYHNKLEHSVEFSACIAGMMFLVLASVVLEGLLRNTQFSQPAAPTPSEDPLTNGLRTSLAAALFLSFLTSAFAAFLMNVWTIPLVVVTGAWVSGFNIALAVLAVLVVILITWEGLQIAAWLTLVLPCILALYLLCADKETQAAEAAAGAKPVPLELTKATFTGLLAVAVAVPGVTSASPGIWKKIFVFCTAATVPLGLFWRLLTHKTKASTAVDKAVDLCSLLAQAFLFCAGFAFWVMAGSAPN